MVACNSSLMSASSSTIRTPMAARYSSAPGPDPAFPGSDSWPWRAGYEPPPLSSKPRLVEARSRMTKQAPDGAFEQPSVPGSAHVDGGGGGAGERGAVLLEERDPG